MADRLVVDASVAAKWFLEEDEPDVELARQLRRACLAGKTELHAPALISCEVGHLLLSASRRKPARLEEARAVACIRRFFALPIHIHPPSEGEAVEAMRMAILFSKSFYDMTYLCLAAVLDCKLCTADERAATSTDSRFPSDRIIPLSELRRT